MRALALVVLVACARPPPRPPATACAWWIVRDRADGAFLWDTCAHGLWTSDPTEAVAFASPGVARAVIRATELDAPAGVEIVCAP